MVSEHAPDRYVIVGVTQRQPDEVLHQAARFARHFEAVLICANADPVRYVARENADGSVESEPLDPAAPRSPATFFDGELVAQIGALTEREKVRVGFRDLAGDPAQALGRLAEVLDAEMIVVGTHWHGFRSNAEDFFAGSVAAHLAHRQRRPVVIVPLSPIPTGSTLPWEGGDTAV